MDAKQVVEKILSDARAEAEQIKSEAGQKCSQMDAACRSELAKYRSETERLASEAASDKKSRMLASARMATGKERLAAQRDLLERVFSLAGDRVEQLPEGEYQDLMGALMVKAAESGDEEVVIGKGESRINEKVIKEVNRRLGPGFKGGLHLASDRADIRSGFILRRGKVRVNVSTEVLLAEAREALEMEITGRLFGE